MKASPIEHVHREDLHLGVNVGLGFPWEERLLSAMYVDKRLWGVTAVQTLSRLNRTHRTVGGEQKRKTFVIDFVNAPEDLKAAFGPYFMNASLETETDPYVVVHLATKLAQPASSR